MSQRFEIPLDEFRHWSTLHYGMQAKLHSTDLHKRTNTSGHASQFPIIYITMIKMTNYSSMMLIGKFPSQIKWEF